jgi:hypothetical protein
VFHFSRYHEPEILAQRATRLAPHRLQSLQDALPGRHARTPVRAQLSVPPDGGIGENVEPAKGDERGTYGSFAHKAAPGAKL